MTDHSEQILELRNLVGEEISSNVSDEDCIRFIVARKLVMKDAVTMMKNWWKWYNSPFPDEKGTVTPANMFSLETLEDPNETLYTELTPHLMNGFDRHGNPIYWERTGLISRQMKNIKEKIGMDNLMLRHLRVQHILEMRLKHSSYLLGKPVEKFVVVFDLQDIKKIPDMTGVKYLKRVLAVDQDYYPERLANIIVINAPSFFASLYKLISPFIDPVTAAKIQVFDHNYLENLRQFVDDSQIPPEFGGQAEQRPWSWPYSEESGAAPDQLRAHLERRAAREVDSVWRDTGSETEPQDETVGADGVYGDSPAAAPEVVAATAVEGVKLADAPTEVAAPEPSAVEVAVVVEA